MYVFDHSVCIFHFWLFKMKGSQWKIKEVFLFGNLIFWLLNSTGCYNPWGIGTTLVGWRCLLGWCWEWRWPLFTTSKTYHQLCTPDSLGVLAFYHNAPSAEAGPPQAGQTCAGVTWWSHVVIFQPIQSPFPLSMIAPFSNSGKFLYCLLLGLPYGPYVLREPHSSASAARFPLSFCVPRWCHPPKGPPARPWRHVGRSWNSGPDWSPGWLLRNFRRECELRSTRISQSLSASSWHEPPAEGLEHWLSPSRMKDLACYQTVAWAFEGMAFVVTLFFLVQWPSTSAPGCGASCFFLMSYLLNHQEQAFRRSILLPCGWWCSQTKAPSCCTSLTISWCLRADLKFDYRNIVKQEQTAGKCGI